MKTKKIRYKNNAININNQNVLNRRNRQLKMMKMEYNELNNSIAKTETILNKYYSYNIIYPKYRNLVAVSSFYEYLESGRCDDLQGYQGAYNKYEDEIRANLIIEKLDAIIESLESIKNNQYMLYSAIQESNRLSKKMIGKFESIDEKCSDISQSADIIAYNSKISADNSEFLKWLSYFESMRK